MCGGDPTLCCQHFFFNFLFPACAGVILLVVTAFESVTAFPRMCGGDPRCINRGQSVEHFSPHVRGNVWWRGKLLYDEVMKYVRAKYGEVSFAK